MADATSSAALGSAMSSSLSSPSGLSAAAEAMKQILSAHEADFMLEFPPDAHMQSPDYHFKVLEFSGTETIQQFFQLHLTLVTDVFDVDLESLLGQHCWLRIKSQVGDRIVAGILEHCEQLEIGRHVSQYRVSLAPSLTPLRLNRTSRVFKNVSTPEIVQRVLKSAGFDAQHLRLALRGQYPKRDFCVQYQESDHDFLSRLLEEEGIGYFFDHVKHPEKELWSDVWVLTDGEHGHADLPLTDRLEFRDESLATVQSEEAVYRLQARTSVRPGRVSLRDYRFKQPDLNLDTSEDRSLKQAFPPVEVYYYPGEYVDPHLGKRLTKVRQEAIQSQRLILSGEATSRALQAGHCFALDLHPRSDFNQRLMVLSVKHEASQPQALLEEAGTGQQTSTTYRAEFSCMPADVPYRPQRVTPRPVIPGIQTARVIGPGKKGDARSEEIYCDEFGRVLVAFHWDRAEAHHESSSCWIRVNQGWAGQGFGMQFIPRVGQEVLVQFLEGDPDRPVIIGRVYNAHQHIPYPLPEHKTRSTLRTRSTPDSDGFNELRFEDKRDQEEIYLHAQKDLNAEILHDEARQIGHDAQLEVGHDRTRSVGNDERVTIGQVLQKQIGSDEIRQVGGKRLSTIESDDNRVVLSGHDYLSVMNGDQKQLIHRDRTVVVETGDDNLHIQQGSSITRVQQTHAVQVEEGDQVMVVAQGDATLSVCHDRNVVLQNGDYNLTVQSGDLRAAVKGDVFVATEIGDIAVTAGEMLNLAGGEDASLEAQQVFINAGKQICLMVGSNSIKLTKEGIFFNGLKIVSEASATQELKAAIIKLN